MRATRGTTIDIWTFGKRTASVLLLAAFVSILCIADTPWTGENETNYNRVTYRWRQRGFGTSSQCDVEIIGPEKSLISFRELYQWQGGSRTRQGTVYLRAGSTEADTIFGCEFVTDVVVDRFTP
jgi:hypothetical protein